MESVLAVDMNNSIESLPATLIVGLGISGNSCARYLLRKGVDFAVMDSRQTPPLLDEFEHQCPSVRRFLGGFNEAAVEAAEELVVAPGIALTTPILQKALQAGKSVVGDIELFARDVDAPVIAITGTNGKSTVTALLGHMAEHCGMKVRVGGNIGTPALDLLDPAAGPPDLYVLEVSSFQLETTSSLNACAAVVLNISADHMDRYDGVDAYREAKERVFFGDGTMVINLDDPLVAAMARADRPCICFSLQQTDKADFTLLTGADGSCSLAHHGNRLIDCRALKLKGAHNYANALAALALGDAFGLPMAGMLEALVTFTGLPHRMQWVGESQGVEWFNDSKGTNVGATLAAVHGLDCPVVLIAGGDGKGADFSPLEEIAAYLRGLVVIGRDGPAIAAVLQGRARIEQAANMAEAVRIAASMAQAGDCVLLSPACASFDMYENYKARGEDFVFQVKKLIA